MHCSPYNLVASITCHQKNNCCFELIFHSLLYGELGFLLGGSTNSFKTYNNVKHLQKISNHQISLPLEEKPIAENAWLHWNPQKVMPCYALKELEFSPIKVILHHRYIRKKVDMFDLALIKVDRHFPFRNPKFVAPICLPSHSFKDQGIKVYVSGWGALSSTKCLTKPSHGPNPSTECSLPFIYAGTTMKSCRYTL